MRRILAGLLVLVIVGSFSLGSHVVRAGESQYEDYALKLKELEVFKGTGNGFDLDREPTRLEGLIMFIRLLGKEEEAIGGSYSHPFTDVPGWADNYVGWAYENGYTKGTGATTFGTGNIQAKSFFTFVLRALGYDDSQGDFSWSMAIEKSAEVGLVKVEEINSYTNDVFLRNHVAKIAYDALTTGVKGGNRSLAEQLIGEGALDQAIAVSIGVARGSEEPVAVERAYIVTVPNLETGKGALLEAGGYEVVMNASDAFVDWLGIEGKIQDGIIDKVDITFLRDDFTSGMIELTQKFTIESIDTASNKGLKIENQGSEISSLIDVSGMNVHSTMGFYKSYNMDAGMKQLFADGTSSDQWNIQGVGTNAGDHTQFPISFDLEKERIMLLGQTFNVGYSTLNKFWNEHGMIIIQNMDDLNDSSIRYIASAMPKIIIIQDSDIEYGRNQSKYSKLEEICQEVIRTSESGDVVYKVYEDKTLVEKGDSSIVIDRAGVINMGDLAEIQGAFLYSSGGNGMNHELEVSLGDLYALYPQAKSIHVYLTENSIQELSNRKGYYRAGNFLMELATNSNSLKYSSELYQIFKPYTEGANNMEYVYTNDGINLGEGVVTLILYDEMGLPFAYQVLDSQTTSKLDSSVYDIQLNFAYNYTDVTEMPLYPGKISFTYKGVSYTFDHLPVETSSWDGKVQRIRISDVYIPSGMEMKVYWEGKEINWSKM